MRRTPFYVSLCLFIMAALVTFTLSSGSRATATSANRHYLILAQGQGSGSTSFASYVSAAGGTLRSNLDAIGVVTADSNNPNFAANMALQPGVQAVAEDPEVQWISPNERAVQATGLTPAPAGVNSEPFSGFPTRDS